MFEATQQCIQGKCGFTLNFTNPRFNPIGYAVTQPLMEAALLSIEDGDMYTIGGQETEDNEELKPPAAKKKKENP